MILLSRQSLDSWRRRKPSVDVRGLCYYCPKKWVADHVCKHHFLAYMGVQYDEDDPSEPQADMPLEEIITADLSHLHAIDGKRQSKSLHLPLTAVRPFRVYVGNRESLLCSHMSKDTRLVMQGMVFTIDLHILPIHGPDVILGMEWLESLGRVTTDTLQS